MWAEKIKLKNRIKITLREVILSWNKMDYSESHSKPPPKLWVNTYCILLNLDIFIETQRVNVNGGFWCWMSAKYPSC